MTMQFRTEFPDFDYDLASLLADLPGARDISWHNDTSPSAEFDLGPGNVRIWFDYSDPALSEFPEDRASGAHRQYLVTDDNDAIICQSNNWVDITTTLVARLSCKLGAKPIAKMNRDELGVYYRATVGYDPFEDCPTIDPEEIRQALREFETGEIR